MSCMKTAEWRTLIKSIFSLCILLCRMDQFQKLVFVIHIMSRWRLAKIEEKYTLISVIWKVWLWWWWWWQCPTGPNYLAKQFACAPQPPQISVANSHHLLHQHCPLHHHHSHRHYHHQILLSGLRRGCVKWQETNTFSGAGNQSVDACRGWVPNRNTQIQT